MSKILKSDSLRFLAFFSSIAARFGNQGQTDYAAANEVLNKLAVYLDAKWPGRVVSINWNPWADVGMTPPDIRERVSRQGMKLISPPAGCLAFHEELECGGKGVGEVIIGDGPWNRVEAQTLESEQGFALLNGTCVKRNDGHSAEAIVTLDPINDPYLRDHKLDGKPVFPFAAAMELMAELAQSGWPGLVVTEISSLRRFRGIILDQGPEKVRVRAIAREVSPTGDGAMAVDAEIFGTDGGDHPCYRGTVKLSKAYSEPPSYLPAMRSARNPFPLTVKDTYRQWLFHGPCFQGISRIDGYTDKGISGVVAPSLPGNCLSNGGGGPWLIDPVLVDSGLQLSILWVRLHYDMMPLISSIKSYRCFGLAPEKPVQCWAEAKSTAGGHIVSADFYFVDESGKVVSLIEDMEASCSRELNRLTGGQ